MQTSKCLLFVYIYLCLISLSNICAQSLEIVESVYLEKDDGLHERTINHTTRDSKGFLYFFSNNYIQRYDGRVFDDVNLSQLLPSKEKLSDLVEVQATTKYLRLHFKSGKEFLINPGGLALIESFTSLPSYQIRKPNNIDLSKETLSLSVKKKAYEFGSKKVTISEPGKEKLTIELPNESIPKFLRIDKSNNVLAAYSTSSNYVHHYYVLDSLNNLHDFTSFADAYESAKDIYAENFFYKWVVCGFHGVKILTLKRKGIEFILQSPGISKGQFGNLISGIVTVDSSIYLTTETTRLSIYNPHSNTVVKYLEDFNFVSSNFGKILYDDERKRVITKGTDNDLTDLYFINIENDRVTNHLLEGYFRDYILLDDGNLLLAGHTSTLEGQLVHYNPKTKKTSLKLKFPSPARCIYYDKLLKQYLVGTKDGLIVHNEDFQEITRLDKNQSPEKYIFQDDIVCITPFANKLVLGSSGGGLIIIDPIKYTIDKTIEQHNGLTDPVVISSIVDDQNNCWIGTYNGLNVIDTDFNIIKQVYQYDGLPSREFNTLAATKHNGELYFGTTNGAVRISPLQVLNWECSEIISLENVITYNGNSTTQLKLDTSQISIPHSDSLIIEFQVNDYFSYPYTKPKIEVSKEGKMVPIRQKGNQLIFSSLNKGLHNLDFKISGQPQSVPLLINITSDYALWKRRFLYMILTLVLSAIVLHFFIRTIRISEKQKTAQNKRISELQLSALQGQMNPHFIFNALGAIQYFIQTHDVNKADEYLSDFALLMRGILDSSSKKFITIKEEIKLLKLYANLEEARFENKFSVHFNVADNVDEETLIPPMIIQPYIENAVNHGLHHLKSRKGKLEITITTIANTLVVIIEDNGIGRQASTALNKEGKHISRAMGITSERIKSINASSDIQVAIHIQDLIDSAKEPMGTRVTLNIKD